AGEGPPQRSRAPTGPSRDWAGDRAQRRLSAFQVLGREDGNGPRGRRVPGSQSLGFGIGEVDSDDAADFFHAAIGPRGLPRAPHYTTLTSCVPFGLSCGLSSSSPCVA